MASKKENLTNYNYKARTGKGEYVESSIRAVSREAVAEDFYNRGWTLIAIDEQNALNKDLSFGGKKRVKIKQTAVFLRQLATMLQADLPVSRALDICAQQQRNPTLRETIEQLKDDVENGNTLADAFAKFPEIFSVLTRSMIKAGEESGSITQIMSDIATILESDVRLRGKIKSAMTYPVTVLVLAIVIVIMLMLFVVPIFKSVFASLGGELPFLTQCLMNASDFMKIGIVPIIIIVFGCITWVRKNHHKEFYRRFFEPKINKTPIFGPLVKKIAIARFARNFGTLMAAGVPIMQVLDIVGATSGNIVIEDAMADVKEAVERGDPMAPALRKNPIFPPMFVEMVSVGEESGEIPEMLNKAADSYDEEVDAMTDALTSTMEPLMLVVLGALVGTVVVALYLPIFQVNTLITKQ